MDEYRMSLRVIRRIYVVLSMAYETSKRCIAKIVGVETWVTYPSHTFDIRFRKRI